MIGPIGLIGKGFAKVFLFAFKGWWIVLTLLILSPTIISSINYGIEQNDLSIPIKDLGLFLVSADEQVYQEVQELKKENLEIKSKEKISEFIFDLMDLSGYLFKNLFVGLWMILFNFILFYKFFLFTLGDTSKTRKASLYAIFLMVILQVIVNGIPFRGIFSLIKFIFLLVGGF